MKNLLTLFLTALTALSFAQRPFNPAKQPKFFKVLPGTTRPHFAQRGHSSAARSSDSCNTVDVLDYSTYNEAVANNLQISYNGSWNSQSPSVAGNEINSSFITINSADNGIYSYVVQAFDSLAFANLNAGTMYSKQLSTSTITLDTLAMFVGVAANDTSVNGDLVNDSLVLSFYSIVNKTVSANPTLVQTYAGYDGLAPFVVGTEPGFMRYVQVPVNQAFPAGQGFAVKFQFFSGDTSSHCWLSYSYADSCGTVTYQGQQYTSPAFPTPFINTARYGTLGGSAFWGSIDSTTPTTASVTNISNQYGYFGIGFPENCSYLYSQNWEFLALVSVQNTLGVSISGANPLTLTCPSTVHVLKLTKTGDYANAAYSWSSSSQGPLSNAFDTIFNPGTYDVTVTNSQGCTATDELVAAYANNQDATPSFIVPTNNCINHAVVFTNTSDTANYPSSSWLFGVGLAGSQSTNASYNYTTPGNYVVTLTISDANQCKFKTTQTITVTSTCVGIEDLALDNNVSILPNPSNGNALLTINGADKNVTITVTNLIGQTVSSFQTTQSPSVFNYNLDLGGLANGTYLVKVQSGNSMATKKVVITK